MKRVYTFGHEQVERNLTVGDMIENKKNNVKMTQVTAVSFDAKSGNYFAKVGSKTIKSYSKAYVERKVKAMVGDIQTAVAAARA